MNSSRWSSARWRLDEQEPVDEQSQVEAGGGRGWMNSSPWRLEGVDGGDEQYPVESRFAVRLLFNHPYPRAPVQPPLHGLLFIHPPPSTVHPPLHRLLFIQPSTWWSYSSSPPRGPVHPAPTGSINLGPNVEDITVEVTCPGGAGLPMMVTTRSPVPEMKTAGQ